MLIMNLFDMPHKSILAVILFLKAQPTLELPGTAGKTKLQKWIAIDWLGTLFCLCMIIP
jgi:hypothetical protein